jgi:hypothetical protein
MTRSQFHALVTFILCVATQRVFAAEACVGPVDSVHIATDTNGALFLYVYSKEIQTIAGDGSTYLHYSGSNEATKVIQAQFLFAKASGSKVCIVYQQGTPAYRWILSAVAVVNADAWPYQ